MEGSENTHGTMQASNEKDYLDHPVTTAPTNLAAKLTGFLSRKFSTWGVEERGICPVAVVDRTESHFIEIFFIWFSANTNILSFSVGTLGPAAFGLGLRDSCIVIVFFTLISAIPLAYFATWGPKLGMRQMCASRYTFGYYGVALPSLLLITNSVGFCVLGCIVGGQALASIADISWTVGIVIISMISLLVAFCGIKVVNWFANLAWMPVLVVFVIAAGVDAKHFVNVQKERASIAQILSLGSTVAGFTLPWAMISSDYTAYFRPNVPSWRVFVYSFLGLTIPTITLQCFGAAAAISAPLVPSWSAGYAGGNVGGLINSMLFPLGEFGKLLMVFLSLSVTTNNTLTTYSMGMAIQTLIPSLVVVPRCVVSVIITVVITLLSIVGQHKLYATLSNFLGVIGSGAGSWVSAVVIEHLYFRKGDFVQYDLRYWNIPSQLPLGAAALGASVLSLLLVIPSIDQTWYTGPIAHKTGDLALEFALTVTALLYIPLRYLEQGFERRLRVREAGVGSLSHCTRGESASMHVRGSSETY